MLGVSVETRLRHGSLTSYNEAHTVSYNLQARKYVVINELITLYIVNEILRIILQDKLKNT